MKKYSFIFGTHHCQVQILFHYLKKWKYVWSACISSNKLLHIFIENRADFLEKVNAFKGPKFVLGQHEWTRAVSNFRYLRFSDISTAPRRLLCWGRLLC